MESKSLNKKWRQKQKQWIMKKPMTKTLSALCVTLLIFMCNSMLVSAAVCSGSSDPGKKVASMNI